VYSYTSAFINMIYPCGFTGEFLDKELNCFQRRQRLLL